MRWLARRNSEAARGCGAPSQMRRGRLETGRLPGAPSPSSSALTTVSGRSYRSLTCLSTIPALSRRRSYASRTLLAILARFSQILDCCRTNPRKIDGGRGRSARAVRVLGPRGGLADLHPWQHRHEPAQSGTNSCRVVATSRILGFRPLPPPARTVTNSLALFSRVTGVPYVRQDPLLLRLVFIAASS